jgi:hypothetical protein
MAEDIVLTKAQITSVDARYPNLQERYKMVAAHVGPLAKENNWSNWDMIAFCVGFLSSEAKRGLFPELVKPLMRSIFYSHYVHADDLFGVKENELQTGQNDSEEVSRVP